MTISIDDSLFFSSGNLLTMFHYLNLSLKIWSRSLPHHLPIYNNLVHFNSNWNFSIFFHIKKTPVSDGALFSAFQLDFVNILSRNSSFVYELKLEICNNSYVCK
jgi:hypothetical protein